MKLLSDRAVSLPSLSQMYQISKEYRSIARTNALLLLWDLCKFAVTQHKIRRRLRVLLARHEQIPGIRCAHPSTPAAHLHRRPGQGVNARSGCECKVRVRV